MSVQAALDRVGEVGAKLLPWGIMGLMGAGLAQGEISEGIQRLVHQNGAVLLLVAILVQYAPRAIAVQQQTATALATLTEAVRDPAALATLTEAVRELPRRDEMRFEQILLGVEHVAEQIKRIELRTRGCPLHITGCPADPGGGKKEAGHVAG